MESNGLESSLGAWYSKTGGGTLLENDRETRLLVRETNIYNKMQGIALAMVAAYAHAYRSLWNETPNWVSINMFEYPSSSATAPYTPIIWTLSTKSTYNYDTGVTYLILRHRLKTTIYQSDVITFGLQFTT